MLKELLYLFKSKKLEDDHKLVLSLDGGGAFADPEANDLEVTLGDCISSGGDGFILGCTTINACNYDPLATEDDNSCIYPEEGFDCNGSCIVNIDECGICGGSGPDVICADGTSVCDSNSCVYSPILLSIGEVG